jgi:hypothetical protein
MSTRDAGSDLRGDSKKQKTDGSEFERALSELTGCRESLFDVGRIQGVEIRR